MPFTLSHIGYVLPIQKKWMNKFSITGLVFGSITPDYDILFRLTKVRFHIFQYNIQTILLLIFPLSLLSAFAFHFFCRNILIDNLPEYFEKKYAKYKNFDFVEEFKKHYLRISLSIIYAILLHLVLDYLCHCINAYNAKIYTLHYVNNEIIGQISYILGIYGLPVIFSLIGFYLIYIYEFQHKFSRAEVLLTKPKILFWVALFLSTLFFSILKLTISEIDNEFFIDFIIISVTSSFIAAFYTNCIIYFLLKKIKGII